LLRSRDVVGFRFGIVESVGEEGLDTEREGLLLAKLGFRSAGGSEGRRIALAVRGKCVWEVGARRLGGWSSPTGEGDGPRRMLLVCGVMLRLAYVYLKIGRRRGIISSFRERKQHRDINEIRPFHYPECTRSIWYNEVYARRNIQTP
jgi:hypothetical protein